MLAAARNLRHTSTPASLSHVASAASAAAAAGRVHTYRPAAAASAAAALQQGIPAPLAAHRAPVASRSPLALQQHQQRRSIAARAADGAAPSGMATAVLGTGCFWCTEACYKQLKGVTGVTSGYAGGTVANPTYEQVCGKKTGHIEVVKVTFDPALVTYRDLLDVFFTIHDPTTPDRQGNDVGPQYASAIFYADDAQRADAEAAVADVTKQGLYPSPIVTKLLPLAADGAARFWPAEKYHWDYFSLNPSQPYCQFVVAPKVAKFRAKWAAKLMAA